MSTQADREQEALNMAKHAKDLRDNPLMEAMFLQLRSGYMEKFTKIKKDANYVQELKDVHDSFQNLIRIEGYMQKCIADGKVVEDRQFRRNNAKD